MTDGIAFSPKFAAGEEKFPNAGDCVEIQGRAGGVVEFVRCSRQRAGAVGSSQRQARSGGARVAAVDLGEKARRMPLAIPV